jgi:hypothetical protein
MSKRPWDRKTVRVTFFESTPSPPAFALSEPRRQRWRGRPDDTLGVPIAFSTVLARNDDAAVLVSGLVAYPSGFTISLVTISRLKPTNIRQWTHLGREQRPEGALRFGIGFADGSKVDDGAWEPDPMFAPVGRILRTSGAKATIARTLSAIGASRCRHRE